MLDGADLIAKQERNWGKHQRIEDPEHRRELLEQKRAGRIPKMRDRPGRQRPESDPAAPAIAPSPCAERRRAEQPEPERIQRLRRWMRFPPFISSCSE